MALALENTTTPLHLLASKRLACSIPPTWDDLKPLITERIHSHPLDLLLRNEKGQTAVYLMVEEGCPEEFVLEICTANTELLRIRTKNDSLLIHKMKSKNYSLPTMLRIADLFPQSVDIECPWSKKLPIPTEVLLAEKRHQLIHEFCLIFRREDRMLRTDSGFFKTGVGRGGEIVDMNVRLVYLCFAHMGCMCAAKGEKGGVLGGEKKSYNFRNDLGHLIMGFVGLYW